MALRYEWITRERERERAKTEKIWDRKGKYLETKRSQ